MFYMVMYNMPTLLESSAGNNIERMLHPPNHAKGHCLKILNTDQCRPQPHLQHWEGGERYWSKSMMHVFIRTQRA